MRTLEELLDRLRPLRDVRYFYDAEVGYIAWRIGTGDNIEVLFMEGSPWYQGSSGVALYKKMVKYILQTGTQPYHSVYAFRLKGNLLAEKFYQFFGWDQVNVGKDLYAGDEAVLVWISWEKLLSYLEET